MLNELRKKIDGIDEELLELFKQRMSVVSDIAKHKKSEGIPVLDRTREEEKLNAISEKADAEIKKYARILYGTLFNLSRKYQHENLRDGATALQKYSSALCEEIREAKRHMRAKNCPQPQWLLVKALRVRSRSLRRKNYSSNSRLFST